MKRKVINPEIEREEVKVMVRMKPSQMEQLKNWAKQKGYASRTQYGVSRLVREILFTEMEKAQTGAK